MSAGSGRRDFGRFHIDPVERTLHHDGEPVALRGKAFELLTLLLSRAPRLVERATIVEALWPGLTVHENNLAVTVSAMRKALQKHEPKASYIQTVPKRGYRWIEPEQSPRVAARGGASSVPLAAGGAGDAAAAAAFVSREGELRRLLDQLRGAAQSLGRVVFIAGEAGIGKTTLLSGFARAARQQQPGVLVLTGGCLQLSGDAEPCLPWFWALRDALASTDGELWLEALREHAAGWYSHLSGAAQPAPPGPRQLVDALCAVSRRRPLLVLLEDFHWADDVARTGVAGFSSAGLRRHRDDRGHDQLPPGAAGFSRAPGARRRGGGRPVGTIRADGSAGGAALGARQHRGLRRRPGAHHPRGGLGGRRVSVRSPGLSARGRPVRGRDPGATVVTEAWAEQHRCELWGSIGY